MRFVRLLCLSLLIMIFTAQPALAIDTSLDDQLLLLVNREHTLDAAWQPGDLLDIARLAPSTKGVMQLRDAAANAYIKMYTAYKEETAGKNLPLNTISGFRNYNVQKQLFNGKVANRQRAGQSYKTAYNNTLLYTALPGTSEHQTGLAIDLSNNTGLSDNFRNTEQGQWLLANCWKYGFILRYDTNKTSLTGVAYEPWHYRYVGLPHSLIIRDRGWVLEEYMDALHRLPEGACFEYADPTDAEMIYSVYYTKDATQDFTDIVNISSDNCGGYVITTRSHRVEELLVAWSEMALHTPPVPTSLS